MDDLLAFISKGKTKFQTAQDAISNDDVFQLKEILFGSDITATTSFPNSPKENLLTYAINRNADKCCFYLITKLNWSCLINMDTIYSPLSLCFIQCYFPVCYEVFKTVNCNMENVIGKVPKNASSYSLLKYLIWPINIKLREINEDQNELANEIELSQKCSFDSILSLLVLSRAKIRRLIHDWMIESHARSQSVPNYFYLINQIDLPNKMAYYMSYSDVWPSWNRKETKPYKGKPRIHEIFDWIEGPHI